MAQKHNQLRELAIKWLRMCGYDDIEVEVKIPKPNSRGYYSVDVVGRDKGSKVAVECGGSLVGKLDDLLGLFNEVWVFPYGEGRPFLWEEGESACQNCGHLI